jgi:hypothetical protein
MTMVAISCTYVYVSLETIHQDSEFCQLLPRYVGTHELLLT